MKHTKMLRILGTALILSLLMTALIAAPASAATVAISPASGIIGTTVTLLGSGYAPSDLYYVYFSSQVVALAKTVGVELTIFQTVASDAADASGVISTTFTVPAAMTSTGSIPVTAGTYYVYTATQAGSIVTVNAFTVVGNPAIILSPTTGATGTSVVITGTGFTPSTILAFYFDTTTVSPTGGQTSTLSTGAFSSTITIPSTTAGAHTVTVTAGTSTASATFTVSASATLDALSPTTGVAGTDVVITGSNFPVSTALVFKIGTTTIARKSGDSATRTSGIFITTITVPSGTATGAHIVTVTAGTASASATFTVTSSAALDALSPATGSAGTDVTISGANFPASTTLVITFDSAAITPKSGDTATLASGSFSTVITVPSSATVAAHTITVTAGSATDSKIFTVNISPTLDSLTSFYSPGTDVDISGSNFPASATIAIKFDDIVITIKSGDATIRASGIFNSEISIPTNATGGDHTITVTAGTITKSTLLKVESTPPSVPTPLAPAMGASLKSPYLFDWNDVTDLSAPVTYELQVATAADFSANSIVFNKIGLKESQYKLTQAEADQISGDAAYYWRERAIDAASNASDWTGAGQFSVPEPFSFIGWPLYLTISIGGVVLFLVGLWLGRHTAFSY